MNQKLLKNVLSLSSSVKLVLTPNDSEMLYSIIRLSFFFSCTNFGLDEQWEYKIRRYKDMRNVTLLKSAWQVT